MANINKTRNELIKELLEYRFNNADYDERDLIINDNWGFTQIEADHSDYPCELKEELLNEYFPKHDIMSDFYDPLIKDVIVTELSDRKNADLLEMYRFYTGIDTEISGSDDICNKKLYRCPCCNNNTIEERGQYIICPVCDWEDDGIDEDHISHCNGMKLSEAQLRYQKKGSIY